MKIIINESIANYLFENFKNISNEDEEWALDFLKQHEDASWNVKDFGYFILDVSGRYSVYYTLWRYKPSQSPHVNPLTYWQNLSQDFKAAVTKAKNIANGIPIYIDKTWTKDPVKFRSEKLSFGKYIGESIADVYQKDPQYITWVWQKIEKGEMKKVSNNTYDLFKYYNEMYWESVRKKNEETSPSKHQGIIGDTFQGDLTVKKISQPKQGTYGDYVVFTMEDDQQNNYITYNLNKQIKKPDIKVGDKFNLIGTIDQHKEFLGIKQTLLKKLKLK